MRIFEGTFFFLRKISFPMCSSIPFPKYLSFRFKKKGGKMEGKLSLLALHLFLAYSPDMFFF